MKMFEFLTLTFIFIVSLVVSTRWNSEKVSKLSHHSSSSIMQNQPHKVCTSPKRGTFCVDILEPPKLNPLSLKASQSFFPKEDRIEETYVCTSEDLASLNCCQGYSTITFDDSVNNIPFEGLSSCPHLKFVTIPGTVSVIGESAFFNSTNLQTVILSERIQTISYGAFYGCYSL